MKKLLFTLCAVLAGFAANANTLDATFAPGTGVTLENNVLTMEPGKTARVNVKVTNMVGMVEGFQWQCSVKDVNGNPYALDGKVALQPTSTGDYFVSLGMSNLISNAFGQSQPVEDDVQMYRIIATNSKYGVFWIGSEAEALAFFNVTSEVLYGSPNPEDEEADPGLGCTTSMFTQGNVFRFTIQTSADWNEEYATLDIDQEFDKVSWKGEAAGKLGLPDLKIKNANWQAPLEDLTGEVTFTVDEATGKVSVNYSGDEDVTIKVMYNGQEVEMPYQLTSGAEPITLTYEVTAEGYTPLAGASQPLSWTEPTPDQTAAPKITYTAENGTLTVTATGAEGDAIILNGPNDEKATGTTTASYDVTYDPYVGYTGTWTATAQADDELVSEVAEKPITVAAITPTVATPVITFAETKDGDVVTAVTVQIENWTSATINGEEFTNTRDDVKTFTANYTADQVIKVDATNDPIQGHSEFAQTAHDEYTLAKLAKKAVDAPEVTPTTGADAVTLNITWPESDGTHVIKVNGQESTQTSFPRQDADYNVTLDIYVTEGPTCAESTHYTETITIPKKEVAPELTGAPVFVNSPYEKPNVNAYFVQLENSESGATIYYQVTDPDGNTTGWLEYTPGQEIACYGAHSGGKDGNYTIEAYAVAPGKNPSNHVSLSFEVSPKTGIDELIDGKAIANVRYFNMAGQEMQEANGMTIVVTTYTDGTTSAVKVMK